MFHDCFIHSSVDGYLGCFHILVIFTNNANIGVLMFFQISVLGSFGYIPRSGIAGSKADPFLIFWGISILLPQWLHQSAFPPTVQKGSPFSTSSPALVCWFIDDSHSDRCEVEFRGFDLHFSNVCLLCRSVYLVLCPLFNWIFFGVDFNEFFMNFGC